MNEHDRAYYAGVERRKRAEARDRRLARLRTTGVRVELKANAGTVAANASGAVLDVRLDHRNIEYMAESALGGYIVEALASAEGKARRRRHELLYGEAEEEH